MKTLSAGMLNYLAGDNATLAIMWQVIRNDGVVMGFTDYDQDIVYNDGTHTVTYKAATGYTRSAIANPSDLSVPNLEVQGVLDSAAITDQDIRAGKYDYATVFIFAMVPTDDSVASTYGIIKLRRGWTGQVQVTEGQHVTELRGLAELLSQNFVELFTLECQADLGDSRCKIDMTTRTDTGHVSAVTAARRSFSVAGMSTTRAAGYYNFGTITWNTGANAGLTKEVKNWDGSVVTLFLPSDFAIAPGDTFTIRQGCDKSFTTCHDTFANVLNFRGFPYIPGLDTTLYPNAALQNPTTI